MTPPSILGPVLLVVLGMFATASGSALAKTLFPLVGAPGATTLRLVLAALILALVFQPWRKKLDGRQWRTVGLYGVAMGAMNLCFYQAISTIPLGVAVALEFTGPLAVAVFGSRRALDFVWIGLALGGLWLLLPLGEASQGLDPVGVAYALSAGACWAGYIIFGQRAGTGGGGHTAALGVAMASIVVLPFGIAGAGTALLDPAILPVALGVALLSSAIPYTLDMVALPRIPARTFGILMSAQPALTALSALVVLGEMLAVGQWAGIGLVVAASAGASSTARRRTPPEPVHPD